MKLSEAIKAGACGKKQITGRVTDGADGRCVIGMAIEAAGEVVDNHEWVMAFRRLFPSHIESIYIHPIAGEAEENMLDMLWQLNDRHKWTIEQIVAWVASVENQEKSA